MDQGDAVVARGPSVGAYAHTESSNDRVRCRFKDYRVYMGYEALIYVEGAPMMTGPCGES